MYGFIVIAIFSWEKNTSAGALLFHFELAGTGGGGGGATKRRGRPIGLSLMLKMQGATMHGGTRGSSLEERRFNVAASPVVKTQHTTQGRGGAIIQVELRDVDSGNKVNERFRTDEAVERVFAEEKPFTYLYTDDETGNIVLMEPNTYAQLDVPKHMFGDSYVFLQDDMRVCVQLYDERPMSASIPTRVTCTVAETPIQVKGASVTPQYKKAVLDNGVTVQVPGHILPGDKIIINTTDNSYMSKA